MRKRTNPNENLSIEEIIERNNNTKKNKIMKANEQFIGKRCRIYGDLENGVMNGKPYIGYDDVVRVIRRVTDTHVICECSRRFLNNENLKIEEC